jgi:hypothetical protein
MPVACRNRDRFSVSGLFAARGETDKYRVTSMAAPGDRHARPFGIRTRKAYSEMITTQQSFAQPRRIRAALIGLGLDSYDDHHRLTRSDQSLVFGGSAETHAQLQETVLLMELELDRQGQRLGDLNPLELAELAWRIDSPELHEIALRLEAGLEQQGRAFEDLSAEELTAILAPERVDVAR